MGIFSPCVGNGIGDNYDDACADAFLIKKLCIDICEHSGNQTIASNVYATPLLGL